MDSRNEEEEETSKWSFKALTTDVKQRRWHEKTVGESFLVHCFPLDQCMVPNPHLNPCLFASLSPPVRYTWDLGFFRYPILCGGLYTVHILARTSSFPDAITTFKGPRQYTRPACGFRFHAREKTSLTQNFTFIAWKMWLLSD